MLFIDNTQRQINLKSLMICECNDDTMPLVEKSLDLLVMLF